VQVLRGLSLATEGAIFAQDVCVQYPQLASEYKARFPARMDMSTMMKRATSGHYRSAGSAATVIGDVQLMVNNCLAFNAGNTYLEDQALKFKTSAFSALDKHFRATGEALAHLLYLLSRSDDGIIFARDVCEEFPDLAAQYKTMFAVRTDLGAMQKKATSNGYKTLRQVMSDIDVMVGNCHRFNGEDTPLGRQASAFHTVARRSLERYFSISGGVESWITLSSSSSPTPTGVSTPIAATVGALPPSRKRGRAEDAGDDVIVVRRDSPAARPSGSWMTPENLKKLITALDRPQDNGMFTTAVAKAFPEIAEQYARVCPHAMDLDAMRSKAAKKQYTSMSELLADVSLIAKNCVTYNGAGHPLAEAAASFLKDATAMILYAQDHQGAIKPPPSPSAPAAVLLPIAPPPSHDAAGSVVELSVIATGPVDVAALPTTPDLTSITQPKEKVLTAPRVALLAHQLPIRIPHAIRDYTITRHLQQLSQRRTRDFAAKSPDATETSETSLTRHEGDHLSVLVAREHSASVVNVVKAYIAALKQRESLLTSSSAALVEAAATTPASLSSTKVETSDASLCSSTPLDNATHALARTLECREHLSKAAALMHLLTSVFDSAFLNVLLYRDERSIVDEWIATHLEGGAVDGEHNGFPWSQVVHVECFIRLMLHVPQLGAVTAALTSSAHIGEGVRVLYRHAKEVPLDAATKGVVAAVCVPLVEDFLCYAASRWDELFEGRI
jgi:hypothetical protein